MAAPDLAAYKSLRDAVLAAHPESFTSDAETELRRPPETYLARIAGAAASGWPFTFTAWQDERLCGAITCERDERLKVRHIGQVVGMMVQTDMRGRGVGRALLEACIASCRQRRDVEQLTLSVTSTNDAAIRTYQRVGFVRYGRLARAIRLGTHHFDKDLMALDLGANP